MFNFKEFLIEKGWCYADDTILKKGTFQICIKNGFFLFFNNNKDVKHNHIATLKIPTTSENAEVVFLHLILK